MMNTTQRRYDIDWLRVIAIGLLLIYHSAIGFQSWGIMLGFITNEKSWPALWIPMNMLNIWRIPLLFFVSGMGVYFSMQSRNWKELLKERAGRILVPLVFGMFVIVPIYSLLFQQYYNFERSYSYDAGHLWFLGNIFIYVLLLAPLFYYLKKNDNSKMVGMFKKAISTPLGLLPIVALFILEVEIINPNPFSMYVKTWHGFFFGLLAFFFGFCFVLSGDAFWKMISKWWWMFLSLAVTLFAIRFVQAHLIPSNYLLMIESCCWIFSVFAFGYKYLNRPGSVLKYLSEAVFPVYILHMIFQALVSGWIFKTTLASPIQFTLTFILTTVGCFIVYEVVRRINIIRPLFGLKKRSQTVYPKPQEIVIEN